MLLANHNSLDLDCTPSEEKCTSVSPDRNYMPQMYREARIFREQLRRQFGEEPDGCHISIKRNPHDFGTYLSIEIKYESNNQEATEYAYRIDREFPTHWDEQAKRELAGD